MPLLQVVVLAVVQGITEFLPISSTAHLALVPWLLNWPDYGLTFTVALHIGTLLAVLVYFFKTWVDLTLLGIGREPVYGSFYSASPGTVEHRIPLHHRRALFWYLVIATIPGALAGWALRDIVATTLRHPMVMGVALVCVAVLMVWGEKVSRHRRELAHVRLLDAVLIGVAQALALVPGVSRSGITMTAALFLSFRRDAAARFSFLLSTPIIAGAALNEFLLFRREGMPPEMLWPFVVGIIISTIIGYASIAWLIRYLQFGTFKIFVYYRVIFGIIIIALALRHPTFG